MTLSDCFQFKDGRPDYIPVEDVKDAIKEIRKIVCYCYDDIEGMQCAHCLRIDAIVGEKLI
jgi:hypothetical protein